MKRVFTILAISIAAMGCRKTKEIYINPNPTFAVNGAMILSPHSGYKDGNITFVPLSGFKPYEYSINGGKTYSTPTDGAYTFSNIGPDSYDLRMRDARGMQSEIINVNVVGR